jgi:hypothetical protein
VLCHHWQEAETAQLNTSLILGFHNESLMTLLQFLGYDAMWNWADLQYGAFSKILAE